MTADQQRAFLRLLGLCPNVALACRVAGVTRRQAYEYRDKDPMFEQRWRGAAAAGVDRVLAEAARWVM